MTERKFKTGETVRVLPQYQPPSYAGILGRVRGYTDHGWKDGPGLVLVDWDEEFPSCNAGFPESLLEKWTGDGLPVDETEGPDKWALRPAFGWIHDDVAVVAPAARLSTDSAARKDVPLASGCLDYFPDALAAVAQLSKVGNDKHNPGQPLHWSRGKSTDHADCIMRHLAERGIVDTDGLLHDVKVAWRALALCQEAIEKQLGLPPSRGSK